MPNIEHIRETLVEKLELGGMPAPMQDEIIGAVSANIAQAVMAAILNALTASDQEELARLIDAQDTSAVNHFIKSHIPESDAFIQRNAEREILTFKESVNTHLHV